MLDLFAFWVGAYAVASFGLIGLYSGIALCIMAAGE